MDLIQIVLVIAVVCFVVWLIVTNLVTNATVAKIIWLVTALVLGFYALRALGIVIPNVIER